MYNVYSNYDFFKREEIYDTLHNEPVTEWSRLVCDMVLDSPHSDVEWEYSYEEGEEHKVEPYQVVVFNEWDYDYVCIGFYNLYYEDEDEEEYLEDLECINEIDIDSFKAILYDYEKENR